MARQLEMWRCHECRSGPYIYAVTKACTSVVYGGYCGHEVCPTCPQNDHAIELPLGGPTTVQGSFAKLPAQDQTKTKKVRVRDAAEDFDNNFRQRQLRDTRWVSQPELSGSSTPSRHVPLAQTRQNAISETTRKPLPQHDNHRGNPNIQSPNQSHLQKSGAIMRVVEPKLRSDMIRIRFICACGEEIWDDYPASQVIEARHLEARLRRFFWQQMDGQDSSPRDSGSFTVPLSGLATEFIDLGTTVKRLFLRESRPPAVDAEKHQGPTTENEEDVGSYYLTCSSHAGDIRPRLHQFPASQIDSDSAYFRELRKQQSTSQKGWTRWLIPRKVVEVKYVEFQLLSDNVHVNLDPKSERKFPQDKAEYFPAEEQLLASGPQRWLASNTLLHYLRKEHHCEQYPHLLPAIPKKLKGKLVVLDRGPPLTGWGIQLVDGLQWLWLSLYGFCALIICSIVGIVWAKVHGDMQGGSGIAQCLICFVMFLVAMLGVSGVR